MDIYFGNSQLLQNTLLPYFDSAESLKFINKLFSELNYEKYNTHIQPHGVLETYYPETRVIESKITYKNGEKDGSYEVWFNKPNNNQLSKKWYFTIGKPNGLYEEYRIDGSVFIRTNWINGFCDNLWVY